MQRQSKYQSVWKLTIGFFLIALGLPGAFAQMRLVESKTHQHAPGSQEHQEHREQLGQVDFRVSCTAEAQQQFNRAAALLHSFEYEQAERAFTQVKETDPNCSMVYWGIAMSNYHPLWAPPTPEELKKGMAAIETGRAAGVKTKRESDYLAAIATFYTDAETRDHRTRALAYKQAMEQVYQQYPDDREAAVFYALALNATALPTDKTYVNQKKAVKILNTVLAEEPNHPGVAHYIIHNFDYPELAHLALSAARSYAKIAPSAAHALHMPSHTFTRLGLWQESIQTNLASATAARAYVEEGKFDGRWFDELHAMDYLTYAYLQQGQDQKAKQVRDELLSIHKASVNFASAYAFAAIPARYTLERRSWSEAAVLSVHPEGFPWQSFPEAQAITYFARALGAARQGNVTATQTDLEMLKSLHEALIKTKAAYWADQVVIQQQAVKAWIAYAEERTDAALELMRSAAKLEDETEKHPVTPGEIVPAHELLGDLLLELSQPAEALGEFEASLRRSPNRFNGLFGAARAAEMLGEQEKAKAYYEKLVELAGQVDSANSANTGRTRLQQAEAFLAKHSSL